LLNIWQDQFSPFSPGSQTWTHLRNYLVGGFNHLGKDYPIYEMENKKCLKRPTSTIFNLLHINTGRCETMFCTGECSQIDTSKWLNFEENQWPNFITKPKGFTRDSLN
jgi:hypothetical protein